MKLEKIQASTPNIFNIINNVSQDSTNFEDLLLNLLIMRLLK